MNDVYGMDAALAAIESELPQTFGWTGATPKTYPCSAGSAQFAKNLGFGGFALESDLVIIVRTAALGVDGYPALNDEITVDGKVYHLDRIEWSPCKTFAAWHLDDPTKGA